MVPLAKKGSTTFVEATPENALNGTYPLTRFLFIYVNKKPNQPLAPLENEFIKMVLSKTGQQSVIKDGYIPLPANVLEKALSAIK
jgi:phosphate transport system substrate-binding protein